MRVFTTLEEAIPEVRRDLSKSPSYSSKRVQNQDQGIGVLMQEAQNYAVTILPGGIPNDAGAITDMYERHMPLYQRLSDPEKNAVFNWMHNQEIERISALDHIHASLGCSSDEFHPFLSHLQEGNHFSYTYQERLIGAVDIVANTLVQDTHSRRAWWPIFHPQDAIRSVAMTRIPCSLGYFLALREQEDVSPNLHITYVSRSTDFERFWLSDIFLAHRFKMAVLDRLKEYGYNFPHATPGFLEGATTHIAFSFHRFTTEDEELY